MASCSWGKLSQISTSENTAHNMQDMPYHLGEGYRIHEGVDELIRCTGYGSHGGDSWRQHNAAILVLPLQSDILAEQPSLTRRIIIENLCGELHVSQANQAQKAKAHFLTATCSCTYLEGLPTQGDYQNRQITRFISLSLPPTK